MLSAAFSLLRRCAGASPRPASRRRPAAVHQRRRGTPLPRAGRRAALRDVPEPVAGRLQRADRPRPAPRSARADARRASPTRRSRSSWSRATASSCCTARRSNPRPGCCGSARRCCCWPAALVVAGVVRKRAGSGAGRSPTTTSRSGEMTAFRDRQRRAGRCSLLAFVLRPLWRDTPLRRHRRARWPGAGHRPALRAGRHAEGARSRATRARPKRWPMRSTQLEAELQARPQPARRLAPAGPRLRRRGRAPRRATPSPTRAQAGAGRCRPAGRSRRGARAGRARTAASTPRRVAMLQHALDTAADAPARALVPRHRAAPGQAAGRSGEDLGAAARGRRCQDRDQPARADRRRARRSRPAAAAGAPPTATPRRIARSRSRSTPALACAAARATPALFVIARQPGRPADAGGRREAAGRAACRMSHARRRRQPDADAEAVAAAGRSRSPRACRPAATPRRRPATSKPRPRPCEARTRAY